MLRELDRYPNANVKASNWLEYVSNACVAADLWSSRIKSVIGRHLQRGGRPFSTVVFLIESHGPVSADPAHDLILPAVVLVETGEHGEHVEPDDGRTQQESSFEPTVSHSRPPATR